MLNENQKSKVGILGGGQLARMLCLAAHNLGIEVVIFSDQPDCPASHVTNSTIIASYNNKNALSEFTNKVEVITFEFENIPIYAIEFLNQQKNVYPNKTLLSITQDRLDEKQFLNDIGIETAPFEAVKNFESISFEYPFIIKTRHGGYDGKGQYLIKSSQDKLDLNTPTIVESIIDFQKELSIITARDTNGNIEFFPIAENIHKNGILHTSRAPADISPDITAKAQGIAAKLVEKVNYIGVIAIEFFLTKNGKLLINEIAPRVHNSGHWSVEACNVSQFEQHIRAVSGLPIKPVQMYFPCQMQNLIGTVDYQHELKSPEKRITLYGKKIARPGRKMGHVTIPTHED